MYLDLPQEPTVDRLWTIERPDDRPLAEDSDVIEWTRAEIDGEAYWSRGDGSPVLAWREILTRPNLCRIATHHPDLPEAAPLPWSVEYDEDSERPSIVDAHGYDVAPKLVSTRGQWADETLLSFVVRAVNELGQRIAGGE